MRITRGKSLTYSVTPDASYPSYPIDLLQTGDSDWSDNASSMPSFGSYAHAVENSFSDGFAGFNQSTGSTVVATYDLGSASGADYAVFKGYFGTSGIFRPTALVVEYSDNNSDWTTAESLTSLTAGGQPGPQQWMFVVDISGDGSHRYWRATFTHGGQWLFLLFRS